MGITAVTVALAVATLICAALGIYFNRKTPRNRTASLGFITACATCAVGGAALQLLTR